MSEEYDKEFNGVKFQENYIGIVEIDTNKLLGETFNDSDFERFKQFKKQTNLDLAKENLISQFNIIKAKRNESNRNENGDKPSEENNISER